MNQGASNQGLPPSFKTNVNRMKTKRWVEAKSYSYDGDDWGDADDYDEYDGYNEPEPAPQRPAGLRQPGQSSAQSGPPRSYGPPPHLDTNRAVSQPPQPPYQEDARGRTNSFGRGDDRRAFSGPGGPGGPMGRYAQQPTSPVGPSISPRRTAYGQQAGPDQQMRQPPPGGPGAPMGPGGYMASGGPTGPGGPRGPQAPFYQQPGQSRSRPSFEGPGHPSHYENRGPPPPHLGGPMGGPIGGPRPPSEGYRTHSMTSNNSDFSNRGGPGAPQPHVPGARPPRKSSLSQHEQQPPVRASSPEPHIAELEAPVDEDNDSPAPSFVRPADIYKRMQEEREKERLSQESSRPSMEGITGQQKASEKDAVPSHAIEQPVPRQKQPLDTVAERKSEYGMEGFLNPEPSGPSQPSRRISGSPVLPEIEGFGEGFGSDFGLMSFEEKRKSMLQAGLAKQTEPSKTSQPPPVTERPEKDLQREPSTGFTSVVHQAFDQPAVPGTPASDAGSNIGRSNSESTSVISPIISRGPSNATVDSRAKETEARELNSIAEEPNSATKGRESAHIASTEELPPAGFVPGHRRNMSTPSPDNSPARTPVLESNKTLRNPQEIEIAEATPSTTTHSNSSASNASRPEVALASKELAGVSLENPQDTIKDPSLPGSRSNSPSKGRVRELADKINSGPNSRRGSQDSVKSQDRTDSRPQNERLESFRPNLPGGWNSYTTNTPPESSRGQTPLPSSSNAPPPVDSTTSAKNVISDPVKGLEDASKGAFAAAAAAGTALAGAFVAAVGTDGQTPEPSERNPNTRSRGNTAVNPDLRLPPSLAPSKEASVSSIVPTPLGMADGHDLSKDKEYFPSVQPLKQPSKEEQGRDIPRLSTPPQPVQSLSLSTDPSPSDQESDRLRKQLVRELSPQPESPDHTRLAFSHDVADQPGLSADTSTEKAGRHESTLLPSEYESYWNDAIDDGLDRHANPADHLVLKDPSVPVQQNSGFAPGLPSNVQPGQPGFVPPQQPGSYVESPVEDSHLKRRFSWEADPEENFNRPSNQPAPRAQPLMKQALPPQPVTNSPLGQTSQSQPAPKPPLQPLQPPQPMQNQPAQLRTSASPSSSTPASQKSPNAAFPAPIGTTARPLPPEIDTSANATAPRAPAKDSPIATATTPRSPNVLETPAKPQVTPKSGQVHVPPRGDIEFRPAAFKEILALKTADERIEVFNTTRVKFSDHQTGLNHWMALTLNKQKEHMDLIEKRGAIGVAAKMPARAPTTGPGAQQQHYQQYLNGPSAGNSPGAASNSSPLGGGKITTQQVQAKGKDILKGAGVLGGKANVAAKGLFAKGMKRFGGGGGDKASSRTPSATLSETKPETTTGRSTVQNASPRTPVVLPPAFEAPSPSPQNSQDTPSKFPALLPETRDKSLPRTPPGPYKLFPTQVPTGRASPGLYTQPKVSQEQKALEPSPRERQLSSPTAVSNLESSRSRSVSNVSSRSKVSNLSVEIPAPVVTAAPVTATTSAPTAKQGESSAVDVHSPLQNSAESVSKEYFFLSRASTDPKYQVSPTLADSPTVGILGPQIRQAPKEKPLLANENTPTQADFPPGISDESAPSKLPPLEQPKRRSEALTSSANASKRNSAAFADLDSKRGSGFLATDTLKPLPKLTADSPRHGSSLATTSTLLDPPKIAASPNRIPSTSRPFSFIGFGDVGTSDLSLHNPLTPESEKQSRLSTMVSEESISGLEENDGSVLADKDIEAEPESILADKDIEAQPQTEVSDDRASPRGSRPFQEPNIQYHPAFRQDETPKQNFVPDAPPAAPDGTAAAASSLPSQSRYSMYKQQAAAQHRHTNSGLSGYSNQSNAEKEGPEEFPLRTSSRPYITSYPSQDTTRSSNSGKQKRRASLFSALSGQSDKSKKNEHADGRVSAEPYPHQPPSPHKLRQSTLVPMDQSQYYQQFGIQQPSYDSRPSVDSGKGKGHRRLFSAANMLHLAGGGKNVQPAATGGAAPAPANKPAKAHKRRLSGFTGFFSRNAQKQATVIKSPQTAFPNGPASPQSQSAYAEAQQLGHYSQNPPLASPPYQGQQFRQKPYEPTIRSSYMSQNRHTTYTPPQPNSQGQFQNSPQALGYPERSNTEKYSHKRSGSFGRTLDTVPQGSSVFPEQNFPRPPPPHHPEYGYAEQRSQNPYPQPPPGGYFSPPDANIVHSNIPPHLRPYPYNAPIPPNTIPPQQMQPPQLSPLPTQEPLSSRDLRPAGPRPQIPRNSTPPPPVPLPPPPPPKHQSPLTQQLQQQQQQQHQQTTETTVRTSITSTGKTRLHTSTNTHTRTESNVSTNTAASSSSRTRQEAPAQSTPGSHSARHSRAHSDAHAKALRQTLLPPLNTIGAATPTATSATTSVPDKDDDAAQQKEVVPVPAPAPAPAAKTPEDVRELRRREIEMGAAPHRRSVPPEAVVPGSAAMAAFGTPRGEAVDTGTPTPLGEGKHKQVVGFSSGKGEEEERDGDGDGEEKVVMSSTAYPGQEWRPDLGDWDGQ